MNDPLYHPHYPSTDGDYTQRLMDNAARMANPYRLMCKLYSDAEETWLASKWAAAMQRMGKGRA
jgi:hypothetical protein